jgi:flagellar motor protein MotB
VSRKRHAPELPWASFADALSGMLFIFVITSFWFAIQLKQAGTKATADQNLATAELKNAKTQWGEATTKAKEEAKKANEKTQVLTSARQRAYELTEKGGPLVQCLESDRGAGAKLDTAPQPNEARVSLYLPGAVPWFDSNSATLKTAQKAATTRVRGCIQAIIRRDLREKYDVLVYLEGHTDNVPINGEAEEGGESNWELSGRRAAAVVRELLSDEDLAGAVGRNDLRIMAVGMAFLKPAWQRLCQDKGPHWIKDDDKVCAELKRLENADYGPLMKVPTCPNQAAPQATSEGLIHWANRCFGDDHADARRALLRRVDLRIELIPILPLPE